MSGGAWSYLSTKLGDASSMGIACMEVLGAIEHELDWGVSGDICYDCAALRTLDALKVFFEDNAQYSQGAVEVVNDRNNPGNRCPRCLDFDSRHPRP